MNFFFFFRTSSRSFPEHRDRDVGGVRVVFANYFATTIKIIITVRPLCARIILFATIVDSQTTTYGAMKSQRARVLIIFCFFFQHTSHCSFLLWNWFFSPSTDDNRFRRSESRRYDALFHFCRHSIPAFPLLARAFYFRLFTRVSALPTYHTNVLFVWRNARTYYYWNRQQNRFRGRIARNITTTIGLNARAVAGLVSHS